MSDIVERISQVVCDYTTGNKALLDEAADEIERLRADAARWRYVRDHCWAQTLGCGRVGFGFEVCYQPRGGATVDGAVDVAIQRESEK